ncbi:dTMP kinase [Lysinibacillus sp. 54212]|uniref:dTMP kinase n=1 Tax=Lysinibacillus sp. 54212 TaxID=3119829 RepID=UPI002FC5FE1D
MVRNLFITFEGPDGAGKTSVLKQVVEQLQQHNIEVMATREPGGIEIAEKIREIILNPAHTTMDNHTEALLYAAARSQHYFEKVKPALEAGKTVLCDRFIDSSLVYQGIARGLGVEEVLAINEFAIGKRLPDATILFDLEPSIGLARIAANRSDEINRLDAESLAFHEQVRAGYLQIAKQNQKRIHIINADQQIESVVNDVWKILYKLLG